MGSQTLPTAGSEDESQSRPRSGTWGSKSDTKQKNKDKTKEKHQSKIDSKKKDKGGSGATSRSNSGERRLSDDDSIGSPSKKYRNRSNSDAGKRKGSTFMASMRSAMMVSLNYNV